MFNKHAGADARTLSFVELLLEGARRGVCNEHECCTSVRRCIMCSSPAVWVCKRVRESLALPAGLPGGGRERLANSAVFRTHALVWWRLHHHRCTPRRTDSSGLHQQSTLHPLWIHSTLHPHQLPGISLLQVCAYWR